MRINLVTPFAEKEAAKKLGARWDGAKKIWYITDVTDLTPFLRWIPDMDAATKPSTEGPTPKATPSAKATVNHSPGVITRSSIEVQHCGCTTAPWEDCEHSAKTCH